MKTVIITAHGSRRDASNSEFKQLVSIIARSWPNESDSVMHAFLELSGPYLSDVIDGAATQGSTEISIFPYFLNSGVHVDRDLPKIISESQEKHPNVTITQLPYIGSHPSMATLIIDQVINAS